MSGFRCKQFYVAHDQCAMKVNTDSLLLGSWAQPGAARSIVDVGTGSGILALMMAQKSGAQTHITALEIDFDAASQAQSNVLASPWTDKISVLQQDVLTWQVPDAVEMIISNPPYFAAIQGNSEGFDSLTSARKTARLDGTLSVVSLLNFVAEHLSEYGQFVCVYPFCRTEEIVHVASNYGLNLTNKLVVQSTPLRAPHLCALRFGKTSAIVKESQLVIRDASGGYTPSYRQLCQDFYLNF